VVYVRLRENGPEQVVRNARPQYPHPEADPSHPRYEPPHLRHQPGDEWEIGGKPHDPDDPGVFGSPGWRPDPRTGRHRRGELPDPPPSWQRPRAQAEPPRRRRFWTEPEEDDGERQAVSEVAQEESFLFGRLREDAWDRFMIKSAPLAAAHWADRAALGRQHRWLVALWLRVFRWVAAFLGGRNSVAPQPTKAQAPVPAVAAPSPSPSPRAEPAVPQQRPVAPTLRPGSQMAQAIRGAHAARASQAEHWRRPPRQERSRPSPVPYMARWEGAFDAAYRLSEAVVL
jgi:hypothetical protein